MNGQEILNEISERQKQGKITHVAYGAFGDTGLVKENCGVVEEIINPPEGGVLTKYFGCSYYHKGFPEQSVVQGLSLAKSMISHIPRETLVRSWPLKLTLLWMMLFQKKKFYRLFRVYFGEIWRLEIRPLNIDPKRYNKMTQEMKRAFNLVANREIEDREYFLHTPLLSDNESNTLLPYEHLKFLAFFVEFFCLFIELDTAYRWPLQDVLKELDKEAVKKDVVKELNRIFTLMVSRFKPSGTIVSARNKIKKISSLIIWFMRFNPTMKLLAKEFLLELDIEKVKLDEDDWYFCLGREMYNYGGFSSEDRKRMQDKIDEEKEHVRLLVVDAFNPDGSWRGWEINTK